MRQVGVAKTTYDAWRKSKDFVERLERSREAFRKQVDPDTLDTRHLDFAQFRLKYFGMHSPWVHAEMIAKFEQAPPGSVTMIMVPPETGKTTLVSDYICRGLAIDPNQRYLYFCKNKIQSRKRVGRIKRRMTERHMGNAIDLYQRRYGPFYEEGQEKNGKPWAADMITVAKADHDEQDYSLEALGMTSSVYGARADEIFMDDVQTADNVGQTDTLIEKYAQDITTRALTGKVFIIGTPMPFYEELLKNDMVTPGQYLIYPVIRNGEPLLPYEEYHEDTDNPTKVTGSFGFTMDTLRNIERRVGEEVWARAFLMNPRKRKGNSFTEAMVNAAKKDYLTVSGWDLDIGVGMETRVIGVDPALGGGCAITAAGLSPSRLRIYDTQTDYNLGRNEEIYQRVESFAQRYRPHIVVFETNALQKGMARSDDLVALSKRYGFQIEEHLTGLNKADPTLGVKEMAGSMVRGEMWIPWGDEHTTSRMHQLITEMLAWRPDLPTRMVTQDTLMSLWFIWLYWMRTRQETAVDYAKWRSRGIVGANR